MQPIACTDSDMRMTAPISSSELLKSEQSTLVPEVLPSHHSTAQAVPAAHTLAAGIAATAAVGGKDRSASSSTASIGLQQAF